MEVLQIVLATGIMWCLVWCMKRLLQQIPFSRIPGPKGHFICGHLNDLLHRNYHRKLASWSTTYGSMYRINVLGVQGLVISDPRTIATLLGQDRGISAVPKLSSYQELDMVSNWREQSCAPAQQGRLLAEQRSIRCSCGAREANTPSSQPRMPISSGLQSGKLRHQRSVQPASGMLAPDHHLDSAW